MSESPLPPPPPDSVAEKNVGGAVAEIAGIVSFLSGALSLILILIVFAQAFINEDLFSAPQLPPNQYWIVYLLLTAAGLPFVGLAMGIATLFQPPRNRIFAISGIALNAFLLLGACCVMGLALLTL